MNQAGYKHELKHSKAMAVIRLKGKSNPNLLLQELIGMLGGRVVKQYKDKIVLSMAPAKRKKKPTALQKERRQTMKEAVLFARRIIADPIQKASWKKRAKGFSNVYQAAVSWYMKHGDNPYSEIKGNK